MKTLGLLLLGFTAIGCGSSQASMTKAEQDNFKGGPMPAGFMEKNGGGPKPPAAQAPAAKRR